MRPHRPRGPCAALPLPRYTYGGTTKPAPWRPRLQQLERADRRRIVLLHSLLRHGAAGGDILGELLSELSTLLGFDRAGYYGFRAGDAELSLEFSHGLGDVWKDFEEAVRACPRWTFDPRAIERPERNRVVTVRAGDARPWREL